MYVTKNEYFDSFGVFSSLIVRKIVVTTERIQPEGEKLNCNKNHFAHTNSFEMANRWKLLTATHSYELFGQQHYIYAELDENNNKKKTKLRNIKLCVKHIPYDIDNLYAPFAQCQSIGWFLIVVAVFGWPLLLACTALNRKYNFHSNSLKLIEKGNTTLFWIYWCKVMLNLHSTSVSRCALYRNQHFNNKSKIARAQQNGAHTQLANVLSTVHTWNWFEANRKR